MSSAPKNLRLDIGCGDRGTGDVNCDLFVGKSPHLTSGEISPRTIPNFVRCDANYLPFRDKAFEESFCSHLLEHKGMNPVKVVKEMIRVSRSNLIIIVPHRFAHGKRLRFSHCKEHERYFNVTNLHVFLRKLGLNPVINVVRKCFPHEFFCLVQVPHEIIANAKIGEKGDQFA